MYPAPYQSESRADLIRGADLMYRTPYKHQTGNCNEQAMRGSPYAKPLEAVVVEWSNKLVYMQAPPTPLESITPSS